MRSRGRPHGQRESSAAAAAGRGTDSKKTLCRRRRSRFLPIKIAIAPLHGSSVVGWLAEYAEDEAYRRG